MPLNRSLSRLLSSGKDHFAHPGRFLTIPALVVCLAHIGAAESLAGNAVRLDKADRIDPPAARQTEIQPNRSATPVLIPAPMQIVWQKETRALPGTLTVNAGHPELESLKPFLAGLRGNLHLQIADTGLGAEGYQLEVSRDRITLRGESPAGVFYGLQTLRQLMPEEGDSILQIRIHDKPRFAYRGLMLDVARHFMPPEYVKRFIDRMAQYKFNRFHWHLTDDQGWRIEIKKYPRLTEIGSVRSETMVGLITDNPLRYDGTPHGGHYTQEEIREIVRYAAARHVTVIPEIEMPGHSTAALAAYPQLACTGETLSVSKIWGVHQDIYCPHEETFRFLEDVLTEVMHLFPGPYIHIGGDEAPKDRWAAHAAQAVIEREGLRDEHQLQSYFIERIEKFVNARGRKIIGWDEIMEGGLAPNATVMSWRGMGGGITAARAGHDVVMAPSSHTYFDYYQSQAPGEPLAIGGYTPLEKVYAFEPVPDALSEQERTRVLGAQGQIWTEYMKTGAAVDYMAYPRVLALAEVIWSPRKKRDWHGFVHRLDAHLPRLEKTGIKVARSLYDVDIALNQSGSGLTLDLASRVKDSEIRFTWNGSPPKADSFLYEGQISLAGAGEIRAQLFRHGRPLGKVTVHPFSAEDWTPVSSVYPAAQAVAP